MRSAVLVCVALASSVLLSACLGGDNEAAPGEEWTPGAPTVAPDYDFASAIEPLHDHEDPSLHGESFGIRQVGHTAMSDAARPGTVPGAFNEVSMGDGIAVVSNYGPHRAFSVVDISDPSSPKHLSDWWASDPLVAQRAGISTAWGVSIFPEGDLVVVSLQAMANPPLGGSLDSIGGGLYLVNLEDASAPVMESFTPVFDPDALIPVGVHTVRGFEIGENRYAAASTANGEAVIFEVVGEAPSRSLKELSRAPGMHDTTVQVHPLTGQVILYGTESGAHLTDISDPANPNLVGHVPNGEDGLQAYHQLVPSDVLIEGRHYAVAAMESSEGEPTPFTLLDTTDPQDPFVVGQWTLPLELPLPHSGAPYRFTGHNVDFDAGRLYIGHSHAGVWVVDVSSAENLADPFAVAFFQPHESPLYVPFNPFSVADVPAVWSAYRHTDGYIYVGDCNTGLYILEVTEPPSPLEDAPRWPHNVR